MHLSPADAMPLRRELAAAFESPELAVHGDQDDARIRKGRELLV